MTLGEVFSNPRASAGKLSVTRFIQRIWIGNKNGIMIPSAKIMEARNIVRTSPTLQDRR